MSDLLSSLPKLEPPTTLKLEKLPPLRTNFRIPRLEEKPQNPILESIKNRIANVQSLPKELVFLSRHITHSLTDDGEDEDIWKRALREGPLYKVRTAKDFLILECTLNLPLESYSFMGHAKVYL